MQRPNVLRFCFALDEPIVPNTDIDVHVGGYAVFTGEQMSDVDDFGSDLNEEEEEEEEDFKPYDNYTQYTMAKFAYDGV